MHKRKVCSGKEEYKGGNSLVDRVKSVNLKILLIKYELYWLNTIAPENILAEPIINSHP